MANDQRPGILDQLLTEAAELGRREAQQGDFPVNLRSTAKDGTVNEIEGVPFSRAAKWAYDNFGIGDPPGEGDGDEGGKGDEGKSGGTAATPLRSFFGGQAKTG